jgi:hypothetical protein
VAATIAVAVRRPRLLMLANEGEHREEAERERGGDDGLADASDGAAQRVERLLADAAFPRIRGQEERAAQSGSSRARRTNSGSAAAPPLAPTRRRTSRLGPARHES